MSVFGPLAVAVMYFGLASTRAEIRRLGLNGVVRRDLNNEPFLTDNGNLILDVTLEGDEALLRDGALYTTSGLTPPSYLIRHPNFVFLPVSDQARTIKVTYRYKPATVDDSGDTLETPEEFDDVIVKRVQFYALADEGESNSSFEETYSARLMEIEEDVTSAHEEGGSEQIKNTTTRSLYRF